MEVRKEMPEEVRKQLEDKKRKLALNVVTEKIPEKFINDVNKEKATQSKLTKEFLQLSVNLCNAQRDQQALLERIKNSQNRTRTVLQNAFKKMKLGKKKNYRWQFDNIDSFRGQVIPPKPEKK